MSTIYEDGVFYHKATALLGIKDVHEALREFYNFLSSSFPMEAMVVHHFFPNTNILMNLYLFLGNDVSFMESYIPFTWEQTLFLRAFSVSGGINYIPAFEQSQTATQVMELIGGKLKKKHQAHLVCCLKNAKNSQGLVRLIGTGENCFSVEQQQRFSMLSIPLGFALDKILVIPEAKNFIEKVFEKKKEKVSDEVIEHSKLIGVKGGLRKIMESVRRLSITDAPVLIFGETGTGKELIADAIQNSSSRKNKVFIKVNCGAIPETLMDSTLFGHEKGSFTGAQYSRPGKFEQANGGTLFLDEIGELSLQAQVRLLRTLQNKIVERVGSVKSIPIDVRIIAATNRDIPAMLRNGTFREDLFHRLNVFSLRIPPLRERMQDLLPLIKYFIEIKTKKLHLPLLKGIAPKSLERLTHYRWPGNVRELENLIERALVMNNEELLELDSFLPADSDELLYEQGGNIHQKIQEEVMDCLKQFDFFRKFDMRGNEDAEEGLKSLDETVREQIIKALKRANGKIHGKGGAAELLDINPDTLRKKIKKLGIVF